ncbi:hypothetical protein GQ457_14G017160 [Hibiscus cannabinus]
MSLLVLEALFCFAFIPLSHSADSLIESTCQQTPYYDFCIYTLQSDPRSSTMDLPGLACVAGNGLNDTATDNLDLVSGLLGSTNNASLDKALKVCIGSYNTIIKVDVPGAIEAAQRNNPNLGIDYTRDAAKQVDTSNTLIETTCEKTPFVDLCISTLKSDPRSSTADVAGLAIIAADSAYAKANSTSNQIAALLKSATDPKLIKALNSCIDSYNSILRVDLPVAILAIDKGTPKVAVERATDAENEAQKCEDSVTSSPISGSSKAVHDLCGILQSIASLLL